MYLIRADGNAKIGAGHLMRCLTIVSEMEALLGSRKELLFLCADEASARLVESRGFRARVLHSDYQNMEEELPQWERILGEERSPEQNVIVVDSYYITHSYLQNLRRYGRVFLLDDMQKEAFPVDAVINYNAFASKEIYEKLYEGRDTECLVGSEYVPVRRQFLNQGYKVRKQVEDILITTGGGDAENIAGRIIRVLLSDSPLRLHIVTGRYSPNYEALQEMARVCHNIYIYHDVQDMGTLMKSCDLAITAGGTTIYELAAMGVPFICFSYAENQEMLTEYIGERQIAGYAGAYHRDDTRVLLQIKEQVEELAGSMEKRLQYWEAERRMIDGMGAERLGKRIINAECGE